MHFKGKYTSFRSPKLFTFTSDSLAHSETVMFITMNTFKNILIFVTIGQPLFCYACFITSSLPIFQNNMM